MDRADGGVNIVMRHTGINVAERKLPVDVSKLEMMLVGIAEMLDRLETQGDRRLTGIEEKLDTILKWLDDEDREEAGLLP